MIHLYHLQNRLIDMKKIFFIGLTVGALAGCAVGPKYSRPETKKPEAYTQADSIAKAKTDSVTTAKTDSITNLKWWDVYQDTVLQKLMHTAIEKNLDLKIAIARVEE